MFERFRKFPAKTQLAMASLVAIVLSLILMAAWYFVLRVQYEAIFTRLRTSDAAVIVGELEKRKIPYRLSDAGTTIAVPQDRADATRLSLAGSEAVLKGEVGFEIFDKSDMGITDFAQKINFQRALQGELERTISTLDGVESARVHLSMGDDRIFRQDRAPPKASVTLRMRAPSSMQAGTVAGVQQLVSAAVPLLDAASVVVLDEGGRVMSGNTVADASSPPPRVAEKQAVEQYLGARVRLALERVFGVDYIAVRVSAEEPPASTAAADTEQSFDLDNRNFGVRVSLRPRNELPDNARERVRALVTAAVALNPKLGDELVFEAVQGFLPHAVPAAPAQTVAAAPSATETGPGGGYVVAAVIGFIALCFALFFLFFRLRRSKTVQLDESARFTFAQQLQSLLDEDIPDGGTARA